MMILLILVLWTLFHPEIVVTLVVRKTRELERAVLVDDVGVLVLLVQKTREVETAVVDDVVVVLVSACDAAKCKPYQSSRPR
jgi:hypothetical protein